MEARCQCGAIRLTCPSDKPLRIYACHCNECRRQSGSAFSVSAIFSTFDFSSAAGEGMSEYKRVTSWGKVKRCYFCRACGSRLIHARDNGEVVTVKAGCLPALSREMMDGAIHIWTKEAVVDVPAGIKESWPEEPPSH